MTELIVIVAIVAILIAFIVFVCVINSSRVERWEERKSNEEDD